MTRNGPTTTNIEKHKTRLFQKQIQIKLISSPFALDLGAWPIAIKKTSPPRDLACMAPARAVAASCGFFGEGAPGFWWRGKTQLEMWPSAQDMESSKRVQRAVAEKMESPKWHLGKWDQRPTPA